MRNPFKNMFKEFNPFRRSLDTKGTKPGSEIPPWETKGGARQDAGAPKREAAELPKEKEGFSPDEIADAIKNRYEIISAEFRAQQASKGEEVEPEEQNQVAAVKSAKAEDLIREMGVLKYDMDDINQAATKYREQKRSPQEALELAVRDFVKKRFASVDSGARRIHAEARWNKRKSDPTELLAGIKEGDEDSVVALLELGLEKWPGKYAWMKDLNRKDLYDLAGVLPIADIQGRAATMTAVDQKRLFELVASQTETINRVGLSEKIRTSMQRAA